MQRFKIILLYFVLPILLFALGVRLLVGAEHFEVALTIASVVVFLIVARLTTSRKELAEGLAEAEEAERQAAADWDAYYSIQQIDEHRHHH